MVQNVKKSIRSHIISLRKQGMSYSEIQKEAYVPKSTLSSWLKSLKLTEAQQRRLSEKRSKALKTGFEKKIENAKKRIEEIQILSAKDIKEISKREFWLMGIMLYWKQRYLNRSEDDIRKGVRFTSSDPRLIKFFLKWLRAVGKLKKEEIGFDVFANESQKDKKRIIAAYWSKITDFPKNSFLHFYFQKDRIKRRKPGVKKRAVRKKSQFGMLRIRVRASSMLARQMTGWIRGIEKTINKK